MDSLLPIEGALYEKYSRVLAGLASNGSARSEAQKIHDKAGLLLEDGRFQRNNLFINVNETWWRVGKTELLLQLGFPALSIQLIDQAKTGHSGELLRRNINRRIVEAEAASHIGEIERSMIAALDALNITQQLQSSTDWVRLENLYQKLASNPKHKGNIAIMRFGLKLQQTSYPHLFK